MEKEFLRSFLDNGYFIGIPSENKVWCMASSIQSCSSMEYVSAPFFYLNNFFMGKDNPFYKGQIFLETTIDSFFEFISKEENEKPNINWNPLERDFYYKQFNSLKKEIDSERLKKGVPFSYQKGFFKASKENKVYLLKKILENRNQKSSYIYGYWNKEEGLIGTTPELLFIQKNKNLHTIALAGTIPNELGAKKDEFISDKKMQKEHKFVIDGLKLSLSKYGKVGIGETKLLELPKLIHLKSDINIEIPMDTEFEFENFLKELHPTAAVGTLPKNPNSNWLLPTENEIENRGYFAAPFGIVLDESSSICICTIRGMQWKNNYAKICAGGGVIHESEINKEWEEIVSKVEAIKYNLGV